MKSRCVILFGCIAMIEGAAALLLHHMAAGLDMRIHASLAQERRLHVTLERLRLKNQKIASEVHRMENLPLTLTRGEQFAAVESFRLLGEIGDLKEWIRTTQPRPQLPEIQFLIPKDWVDAAGALGDGREDADFVRAWRKIRDASMVRFSTILQMALADYANKNQGNFPDDPGELAGFIPGMNEASLRSHYFISTGPTGASIQSIDHALNLDDPDDADTSIKADAKSSTASYGKKISL
ncbi:MAG TPA: hypothetical protein VFE25_09595 [Opitutaceae bacterium]|nr:hypothetical protein [Opitutaceae bacterium]